MQKSRRQQTFLHQSPSEDENHNPNAPSHANHQCCQVRRTPSDRSRNDPRDNPRHHHPALQTVERKGVSIAYNLGSPVDEHRNNPQSARY